MGQPAVGLGVMGVLVGGGSGVLVGGSGWVGVFVAVGGIVAEGEAVGGIGLGEFVAVGPGGGGGGGVRV